MVNSVFEEVPELFVFTVITKSSVAVWGSFAPIVCAVTVLVVKKIV